MKDIQHKLSVARGENPADLVLKNGRIVNVLSGEIHEGDVAVSGGRIVGIGSYEGRVEVDLEDSYVAPAFIDGHIHLESTMLTVAEFARAVVPRGTGAVVTDPHEYANVVGLPGIEYILESAKHVPVDVFVMMSSCVPATHLETSGARLGRDDIFPYMSRENVAGVAEMMNFPGVYNGTETDLGKINLGVKFAKMVDGHAPGLTGPLLNAYILAGVTSDHECTTLEEAREKVRRGMHVLVREGTAERNLHDILPLVTAANAVNFSFATDDKHPADLEDEGHIDHHVRESIRAGLDPMLAIQMATINTARHYRLRNHGAIAPRCHANLIVFDSLEDIRARLVYYHGDLVARDGAYLHEKEDPVAFAVLTDSMRVKDFTMADLAVEARVGQMKVIDLVPRQIVTTASLVEPKVERPQGRGRRRARHPQTRRDRAARRHGQHRAWIRAGIRTEARRAGLDRGA
jgi:adenine deaminase